MSTQRDGDRLKDRQCEGTTLITNRAELPEPLPPSTPKLREKPADAPLRCGGKVRGAQGLSVQTIRLQGLGSQFSATIRNPASMSGCCHIAAPRTSFQK